eukprot:CAMPEP_0197856700 /NCGR_PEP_ID=MMETSP1438-20131217/29072_1 /TAXON_ID=1461541 /ORGANISM="Pterosperma sp., Strain CCMP1384" /LENGTH=158 /DNA_ID=CAMNT_0043472249 /DNA_START=335 /DNA_END=811 /DNA_ORIENTATION=-
MTVGLAHCFVQNGQNKLEDQFVIEPVAAGTVESLEAGAQTSYVHIFPITLGDALEQDKSILPEEFQDADFGQDFAFRCQCVARTWGRPHAQEVVRPMFTYGELKGDYNFNVDDHKRILNAENIVSDSDNVKQDMSIDVYGREQEEEDLGSEIERLSNA